MASSFMRNRFINGAMEVWQRNTTFSTPSSGAYTADRMFVGWAGAAPATVARVTGPTGFRYALRVTGAASNTTTVIGQKIESANIADLAGKTVTLSVVLLASSAQTFTWSAFYANATDDFSAVTQISTGTWSVTTSAATYSANITLPSQATNGLQVQIYPAAAGAFTSGTFDMTGLQLEQGSVATPYERRLYGQELLLCQRYCQTRLGSQSSTGLYMQMGWGNARSTSTAAFEDRLTCTMRISPSLTIVGAASGFYIYSTSVVTCSTIAYDISDPNTMLFSVTTPATLTNLAFYTLGTQTATAQVLYTAEL